MRRRVKAGTVKDSRIRALPPRAALRARGPSGRRSWVTLDVRSSSVEAVLSSGPCGNSVFPCPAREACAATMLRQIIGQARKHPSLIPLFIFIGAGGTGAALYVLRLALFNPDVSWDRKNNPEPWNKLGPNDQYKFYSVNVDYSKLKKEGPDF
ncbi:unnamed protein product [Nyctereutes procyonoides]|uniref:Cytochrome c oxidase subunit NDUFA4 n=2 Tax=Nyctereutes procyonoides TaxID=34880 RepID=A0A812A0W7_NYCPR|nr:unnamed protein product [Nyctereutes procyonoides]